VHTIYHNAVKLELMEAHGTFSKTHHILGHKASISKYKKIEIIPCILSIIMQ